MEIMPAFFSDAESCKHKFEIMNILAGEVHKTRSMFTDYKTINICAGRHILTNVFFFVVVSTTTRGLYLGLGNIIN